MATTRYASSPESLQANLRSHEWITVGAWNRTLDLHYEGPREEYIKIGVCLYEASIKCDWKLAKKIFDTKPEFVRYAITENGETALHVSASAKGHKKTEEFVQHLVDIMTEDDLTLQNKNHNTAFYLAAAAGNNTTVKIMMAKNKALLTIPGAGIMMPLYAAAVYGYYDVVKYLYENTNLYDDGWNLRNRGGLLEKCVENDMFDIAQLMVEKHPELATNGNALRILASKPEKFSVKINILTRGIIIRDSVLVFLRLKKGAPEKEDLALLLLRTIWQAIAKKPKKEIDNILRGPPDPIKEQNKSALGWFDQATRLQLLISEYVVKMNVETNDIRPTEDDTRVSGMGNEAQRLQNLIFRHLVQMHDETHNVIKGGPTSIKLDNKPLTGKEYQAVELHKLISRHIVEMHNVTRNIIKITQGDGESPLKLRNVISKYINNLCKGADKINVRGTQRTYSSRVPFIAAEVGNTNFIVELIRQYPDLMWQKNDENQTIFHVAVKNRHEGIYNLLYEIGAMKDLITPLRDKQDNHMLHLVGLIFKQEQIQNVSRVGLQMQRELLWFKEVQKIVPPSYKERKNADNLTPHELFTKEHKDLVRQDEKWMKTIAGQCMVVAALIATMVFTAAYTIPGGYDQDNGIPIFHSEIAYKIFIVADAISLLSSTTSILYMFVSVFFSSNYSEIDFLETLPKKLILGLLYLSISIISMLIAISVGFFILYQNGTLWMPIVISVFALFPFYRSFKMFCLLLDGVIRLEIGSRFLFKPKKPVLYYKNPRV
ncbi:uncharacterized protein [Rutidosis leptorrhynchoides]|uniref:uncharacterized protein n=1 Tax=Rutidosis leptorrhynchoides TaxID=125765 RepID=UPI003A990877